MKQFMLLCLLGLASAKPQGYNYFLPNSANLLEEKFHPSIGSSQYNGEVVQTANPQHLSTNYIVPNFAHSNDKFHSTIGTSSTSHVVHTAHAQPLVTKHFYLHAAPEETEEEIKKELSIGQPRINYKIVFIKAPSYASQAAKLALKQAQVEDKTVIYVLSQKKDVADIQSTIEMVPQHITKPEVFFIKYKTAEEALHAQHQIQAQYDALGGTTKVSDEGIAPVSSVIGILQNQYSGQAITTGTSSHLSSNSGQSVLISGAPSQITSTTSGESMLTSGTTGHSVHAVGSPAQIFSNAGQSTYLPPNN